MVPSKREVKSTNVIQWRTVTRCKENGWGDPTRGTNRGAVLILFWLLFCGSTGKESACNAGNLGLIPGSGRSPGEEKVYPLQFSGLENSMHCIVLGVTRSQTRLSNFHFTSVHRKVKWGEEHSKWHLEKLSDSSLEQTKSREEESHLGNNNKGK